MTAAGRVLRGVPGTAIQAGVAERQAEHLNLSLFNTLIISDNSRIWILSVCNNYITNL